MYNRDDMNFLNHIPDRIQDDTKMVCFDVTKLYTNIPHDLGVEACAYWIEKNRNQIPSRFVLRTPGPVTLWDLHEF